jgi:5-methylcytosine-specific restriction endonuclease McrA
MGNFIDLTNQKFGKLIALKQVPKPDGLKKFSGSFWLCKCDCGNEKIVVAFSLKRINKKIPKSCGCLRKKTSLVRLEYSKATFNILYSAYKNAAKSRNIKFELNKDEFKKITQGNCFYCGIKPEQIIKSKNNNGNYIYNGIDRVNSSKGYILNNVVACCGKCNKAKSSTSLDEFLKWIDRVYTNMHSKDKI